MRTFLIAAVAGVAMGAFQTAAYADGADEAKEHGCVKCHDVGTKKVGPSWKDVSAKYKGKKVDELVATMKTKPVHKQVLQKAADSSLKAIGDYVMKQ